MRRPPVGVGLLSRNAAFNKKLCPRQAWAAPPTWTDGITSLRYGLNHLGATLRDPLQRYSRLQKVRCGRKRDTKTGQCESAVRSPPLTVSWQQGFCMPRTDDATCSGGAVFTSTPAFVMASKTCYRSLRTAQGRTAADLQLHRCCCAFLRNGKEKSPERGKLF